MNWMMHKWISLLLVAVICLPFLPLFFWAFSQSWFYPHLIPQEWGLRAWEYVFGTAGDQIMHGIVQSLQVAVSTAVTAVAIGIPAGRGLGLYDFKGKDLVSIFLMLPVIVPPLCVSMGLQLWFLRLGLTGTRVGVVLVHLTFCLPYAVFVMWGVFSNYNVEYEDQARSLGATALSIWLRITLPMIFPGVVVAALFAFLLSWSQYLSTLIIGGGRITTLPVLLFALMGSGDRPVAAAVSIVFVLPALLALAFSSTYVGGSGIRGVR